MLIYFLFFIFYFFLFEIRLFYWNWKLFAESTVNKYKNELK